MAKSKLKPLTMESTTANLVLEQMKNVNPIGQNQKTESEDENQHPRTCVSEIEDTKAATKKRIGLNIVITPSQNEALDIIAKYRDISKTQLLRELVDAEIEKNKEKIKKYKEFFGR